jgi:predicted ATPase
MALTGKQFIGSEKKESWSDETYRFLHVPIRESAYSGMLKRTRAELHERFAGWLQQSAEGRLTEVEEIVGYHLEQAYQYLEASDRSTSTAVPSPLRLGIDSVELADGRSPAGMLRPR